MRDGSATEIATDRDPPSPPSDIRAWLTKRGLGHHAPAFEAHKVDLRSLAALTSDELKELGVAAVGERQRILAARHTATWRGRVATALHMNQVTYVSTLVLTLVAIASLWDARVQRDLTNQSLTEMKLQRETAYQPVFVLEQLRLFAKYFSVPGSSVTHQVWTQSDAWIAPADFSVSEVGAWSNLPRVHLKLLNVGPGAAYDVRVRQEYDPDALYRDLASMTPQVLDGIVNYDFQPGRSGSFGLPLLMHGWETTRTSSRDRFDVVQPLGGDANAVTFGIEPSYLNHLSLLSFLIDRWYRVDPTTNELDQRTATLLERVKAMPPMLITVDYTDVLGNHVERRFNIRLILESFGTEHVHTFIWDVASVATAPAG